MSEPVWLTLELVLKLHEASVSHYGGRQGVRDENLLGSALARPQQQFAYGQPTLHALTAAYAFGVARNHPFIDGNKRTALAAADVFAQLNGFELVADEKDVHDTFFALGAGHINETALAAWIAAHASPLSPATQ